MKKKYIWIFILFLGLNHQTANAQITDNPINKLVEKIYQNDLLSTRFLRDFALIKSNTFKKKTISDMDKSIAMFDDNMSYIILHLPDDRKIKENFLKLENYWNIYRLHITNYESEKYSSLVLKSEKLGHLIYLLSKEIPNKHKGYSKNKKPITLVDLAVENNKNIDKMLTAYIFKSGLKHPEVIDQMDFTLDDLKRNLKKIKKYKALNGKANDLISDLSNTIDAINSLLKKDKYNPKMMYAYVNSYSKKNFKLIDMIIQTIN